jgi:hypothetical protein
LNYKRAPIRPLNTFLPPKESIALWVFSSAFWPEEHRPPGL